MPRQRMIQPGIWTDEGFLSLSIAARLMFIGMISGADDEGRGLATDRCLKASVFPSDDVTLEQVRTYRDEVAAAVNVKLYDVDGKKYYQLVKWRNHQRLERPSRSNIPAAPECSGTAPVQVPEDSGTTPAELREVVEEKKVARVSGKPDPVSLVITYLNQKTGRNYNPKTKATHRLITARIRDGHHFDAFQRVIDSKVKAWAGDPKMADYLRPETLFGTKFDSYLASCEPVKVTVKTAATEFDLEEYERTGTLRRKV